MQRLFFILFTVLLLNSCSNGQSQAEGTSLTAGEFANKIKEYPTASVLDVRTPEEFSNGHLPNALNYDWNGSTFDTQTETLDKTQPVFVYCLSGGRSSSAAAHLRSMGFATVYELDGGLMKWRSANLPETTDNTVSAEGMTQQQFEALLQTDTLVLVDFYADWCAPCQKMKPYLDEMEKDQTDKVIVIRINADENPDLCKTLGIEALPVLQLYRNKTITWKHTGFINKADLLTHLH